MSETVVTLPAPEIPSPPLDKFERERHAFYRLLPELLKIHKGQYVAVHGEQVIDSDADLLALLARVQPRVGNVDLYCQLVTDEPRRPLRAPHARLVRRVGDGR